MEIDGVGGSAGFDPGIGGVPEAVPMEAPPVAPEPASNEPVGYSMEDTFEPAAEPAEEAFFDAPSDDANATTLNSVNGYLDSNLYNAKTDSASSSSNTTGPGATTGVKPLPTGKPNSFYDGAILGGDGNAYPAGTPLSEIPPTRPSNGNGSGTTLFVNGISTPLDSAFGNLQTVADGTGTNVYGVYNATEGFVSDIVQRTLDNLRLGHDAAVSSLTNTLYQELSAGHQLNVIGHSAGAATLSRALSEVSRRFNIDYLDSVPPNPNESWGDIHNLWAKADQYAQQKLSNLNVETWGGASNRFTGGPHYTHYVNTADPVPMGFGWGTDNSDDPNARVVRFFTPPSSATDPLEVHSLPVYLAARDRDRRSR